MRSLRTLFVAAALIVPLAGCDDSEIASAIKPKEARADRATAMHGVSFSPSRGELSAGERQQLADFVRSLPSERPVATLLTSPQSPGLQAQRAAAVSGQLQAMGVRVAGVARGGSVAVGPNTVLVSAESWSARTLPCPDWSKTGGVYDPWNLPGSNLGCANARNLADMVDDPRDIEVGRTPGPASGHLGAAAVDRLYNDKVKGSSSGGQTPSSSPTAGTIN
jgi:pilus biogenesis lipoprotein CpaD